jgi:predicted kinase
VLAYVAFLAMELERLGAPEVAQLFMDASWRHESWRSLAHSAAGEAASDLVEIRCQAPSSGGG